MLFTTSALLSFLLFVHPLPTDARKCNPSHLKDAMVFIGTKENFHYHPWTSYTPKEGTVKFLKLRGERVPEICKYYLPSNVMEVILQEIELEYIEPGYFASNSLEQVIIQQNNLHHIIRGVFSDTNIRSLVLSENNIETIESGSFENMTRLEAVALDYNNLKKFDPDWFNHDRVLYEVSFKHNQLTELPEGTTKNMVESMYTIYSTKVLGCINFDNNNIRYIHPSAFQNLKKFGTISLNNNEVLELSEHVFERFDFLFSLYMNTNKFICFNNKTISSLHGVKRLFLGDNRINRDCVRRIKDYFEAKNDLAFFGA